MNNDLWSLQIELCNYCSRHCPWCGIQSLPPDRKKESMSIELADQISKELGSWLQKGRRIEFALHGEPLLNKNVVEIIHLFRTNYPKSQLMITTNADPLKNHDWLIDRLFDVGLNILLVDAYEKPWLQRPMMPFEEFNVYQYRGNNFHKIVLMDNYSPKAWTDKRRKLNNQAGNVPDDVARRLGISVVKEPLKKRCSNPFHELAIKVTGEVVICCMDVRKQCIIGKFPDQSLESIWNSDKFNLVRQLLYNKQRILEPCSRCDYSGFKTGLLKDPHFPLPENLRPKEPTQTHFTF